MNRRDINYDYVRYGLSMKLYDLRGGGRVYMIMIERFKETFVCDIAKGWFSI